ncbi:hypothetical protein ACOZ4F_01960 [Haloarcula marismortui]|uniref:hypothetical protein n=1 Tax=Haloarcula marismortui TaxID=2238 RepID=UPI003C72FF23
MGHFHIISPGGERYEYQRVSVTATDDSMRFSVDGEWANRPESIAGIGCDGWTDTSSAQLCVLETWLANESGQPRTVTIDRTDKYWTAGQPYAVHGGQFYERTQTTHRASETVPEGQVRVTLTPHSAMQTLDAIAVPIERAPPELARVIQRDSFTTDHYVHGAEIDTDLPSVSADEYDDGGMIVETDDGFAVVTTSYSPGKPVIQFVASVLQWLLELGLVAAGGHRYLTHL